MADPLTQAMLDRTQALKGVLPPARDGDGESAPILGRRPTVLREDDPYPHQLLAPPDVLPRPMTEQRNGSFYDAVSQLMAESPQLGSRIGQILLKRISEPGVIGEPTIGAPPYGRVDVDGEWKKNSMVIDPRRMQGLTFTPLDVIKHELTHLLGYGENDAYDVSGLPTKKPK